MNTQRAVIVTGGKSGIGEAIVNRLLDHYTVISIDIQGENYKKENLIEINADVSNEEQVKSAYRKLTTEKYEIFALVNNAGISHASDFLASSVESWNKTLEVNLIAPFIMSREFANRSARKNEFPRKIINIASVSGMVGMPRYSAYNCSKAGLIELTKTMALELAPEIHTCAICPGYILTPMQKSEYSEIELARCAADNPSKRLGSPSEIAELVAFILSDKNNYLNGSILVMDGGETAGGMASK